MLTSHEKLRIPDENKTNDLVLEVNWSKDPKIVNCQVIRVVHPDGKESYVKKEHFMAALFAFGAAGEQREIIPRKIQTVRKYQTMLGIVAKRDIKKGERINVEVDIPLPDIEEEIISQANKLNKRTNIIQRV